MNQALVPALKRLRLSGLLQSLEVRLQEAKSNQLGYDQFLEILLQDELTVRQERLMARRVKAAGFPCLRTLDQFNWDFNPQIDRKRFFDLAAGEFIRKAQDVLLVGPPGVGKTHLAQALGYRAIQMGFLVFYRSIFDLVRDFLRDEAFAGRDGTLNRYLKPDLLIIDDMGLKQLPPRSGESLFEIIMRRYETRSTLMTSNRPLEEWGKLIGDVPAAGAILDRFLHHAEIIPMKGRSYRLKDKPKSQRKEVQVAPDAGE